MQKGFIDKNRRIFNLRKSQVENVLPEHYAQYYPKFISLLKLYYEWQKGEGPTDLLNHLFASRDINETEITLLSYIEDELLLGEPYSRSFGDEIERRAIANFSSTLFRSKGTKFAIEWFFRSFYGIDSEVIYPKQRIFQLNDPNSLIGTNSLSYITDDKLYQTYAMLVRVGIPISKWKDAFKLFAHPAGMYLGGEVLISGTDKVVSSHPSESTPLSQHVIPAYTLSPSSQTINEGQQASFTVFGSDVPDNTETVFYFIRHGTGNTSTTDSDFYGIYKIDAIENIVDLKSPGYVSINEVDGNAQGNFSIDTFLDSVDDELNESFTVYLSDRYGFVQASSTVQINNVPTTYTLTIDSSREEYIGSTGQSGTSPIINAFLEGDTIPFVITGIPSNPPNHQLHYYIEPIGTDKVDSDDFDSNSQFIMNPQPITVINDSARFTISTSITKNNSVEEDEFFRVILMNGSTVKDSSNSIVLRNLIPKFDILLDSNTIYEGSPLEGTIEIDPFSVGTRIDWYLGGDSDSRIAQGSGFFVADSVSNRFEIPFFEDDSVRIGGVSNLSLNLSPVGYTPDPYSTISFDLLDKPPTYEILADPVIAAKGESTTLHVKSKNVEEGSKVYLEIGYNQTDSTDFATVPPLFGSREELTINNLISDTYQVNFANSPGTTAKTFNIYVFDSSSNNNLLAQDQFIITPEAWTLTPNKSTVYNGGSVEWSVEMSGAQQGTYSYLLRMIDGSIATASQTFDSSYATSNYPTTFEGDFEITGDSGIGTFTTFIKSDVVFQGINKFTAEVRDQNETVLRTSNVVTLENSTVTQTLTLSVDDITEGEELVCFVQSSTNDTVYLEISGDASNRVQTKNKIVPLIADVTTRVSFGVTSYTDTYEDDLTGTIKFSIGSWPSGPNPTAIYSENFVIKNSDPTVILTVDDETPTEGNTVNFSIQGTNIKPTVYYRLANEVFNGRISEGVIDGSTTIKIESPHSITTGMVSSNSSIPGFVVSASQDLIRMSQPVSSPLSQGTVVYFANQEVFDDYDSSPIGQVNITNNAGSFALDLSSSSSYGKTIYEVAVYDSEYNGSLLSSQTIDIQPSGLNQSVDILLDGLDTTVTGTPKVYDVEVNGIAAQSSLKFYPNGDIYATGNESPSSNVAIKVGQWADPDQISGSDYTIVANIINGPTSPGVTDGSYSTSLVLSTIRTFSLNVSSPATAGTNSSAMTVSFTITETLNQQNTDTVVVYFAVKSSDVSDGAGAVQLE